MRLSGSGLPFVLITRLTCASRLAVLNVARGARLTQLDRSLLACPLLELREQERSKESEREGPIERATDRQTGSHRHTGCRLYIDTRFHRQMLHETRFIERTSRVRVNANVHMLQLLILLPYLCISLRCVHSNLTSLSPFFFSLFLSLISLANDPQARTD